jgi:type I restriction enzyme S subunit
MDLRFSYFLIKYVGLNHLKNGTSNPSLTRDAFGAQYFPVPPLEEQRAIASVLTSLDDKIESNRSAIDLAQLLGDQLFIRADPRRRGLGAVATIVMGSSPPGTSYNEDGDGLPFYQGTRDFGVRFPRRRVWTTAPVRLAEAGDTLVSVRAPVGDVNRARERCCIGRGVAAISSTTNPHTLFYSLRNSESTWAPFQSEGTVFGSVNKADLTSALIPWPTRGVEESLAAIEAKIASLTLEMESLGRLLDALLPELLSGRILVPAKAVAA